MISSDIVLGKTIYFIKKSIFLILQYFVDKPHDLILGFRALSLTRFLASTANLLYGGENIMWSKMELKTIKNQVSIILGYIADDSEGDSYLHVVLDVNFQLYDGPICLNLIKLLLDSKADINKLNEQSGYRPLHTLVDRINNWEFIDKLHRRLSVNSIAGSNTDRLVLDLFYQYGAK